MRTVVKRWMANQVQPLHRDTEIVQRTAHSMGRRVMSSSDRDNRIGAGWPCECAGTGRLAQMRIDLGRKR